MNFKLRFKVWLENADGKPVIGLGKVKVLIAIRKLGSIAAAAREMKQPYRNVWAKVREAEKQCGFKLVKTGPIGSQLTEDGEKLLLNYMRLYSTCSRSAHSKFHQLFGKQDFLPDKPQIDQDSEL
jgi:molybdate transport system regulatory protein